MPDTNNRLESISLSRLAELLARFPVYPPVLQQVFLRIQSPAERVAEFRRQHGEFEKGDVPRQMS